MKRFNKIVLLPVLALALVASFVFGIVLLNYAATEPVYAEGEKYVYFADNWDWASSDKGANIYAWVDGGSSNGDFPGYKFTDADKVEIGDTGEYCYRYDVQSYEKVIFAGKNGYGQDQQTDDLNVEYIVGKVVYLIWNSGLKIEIEDYVAPTVVETTTVYFYCTETPYAYAWKGHNNNAAWPGVAMTKIGESDWYSYDVAASFDTIVFSYGGAQTGDLTVSENLWCYNNIVYESQALAEAKIAEDKAAAQKAALIADGKAKMAANPGYYIVGAINGGCGDDEIDFGFSSYRCLTMAAGNQNAAEYWSIALTEGDRIKIVYCDDQGNFTWSTNDGDYVIGATAVYNVKAVWNEGEGNGFYTDAVAVEKENFDIQEAKLKFSADGKYVLLVAGITLNEKEQYIGYNIGFVVNGKLYSKKTYYTAFEYRVDAEDDSKTETKTVEDIYGDDANALIVEEIALSDLGSPETLEVCAYVYNGSTVVDCGNIYTKTLVS